MDKLYSEHSYSTTGSSTHLFTLVYDTEGYTFIACGTPLRDNYSFAGFVNAFDTTVWIHIIIFVLFWPLVLSYVENNFSFIALLNDTEAFFIGLLILLEQSHIRTANKNKRGSLYVFCGLTLLVAIVVSNAYRQSNIEEITASFKSNPFDTFNQLTQHKFDILTYDKSFSAGITRKEIVEESGEKPLLVSYQKLKMIINYTKLYSGLALCRCLVTVIRVGHVIFVIYVRILP